MYVSLYARPSLAFLDSVFHEADTYEPGVVFVPSRCSRAELAAWFAFVPFMSVDLRADVDSRVFATDASSRTCAAVVSELPEELCREIWRQRPRRGVGQSYVDTLEETRADDEDDEDDADDDADDDVSASDSDADCQLARSTWSYVMPSVAARSFNIQCAAASTSSPKRRVRFARWCAG